MRVACVILLTGLCIDSLSQTGAAVSTNQGSQVVDTGRSNNNTTATPANTQGYRAGSAPRADVSGVGVDPSRRTAGTDAFNVNTNKRQAASALITGGNDTTFNAHTVLPNGVTSSSGAVDRSGQAQFGQTNWGTSRSTIGESQWTIPPPVTVSYNKAFPAQNTDTWLRNQVDTTVFSDRSKVGAQWARTSYNTPGQRRDIRTEYPLIQAPRPVAVYLAKQPSTFGATVIYKLQVQGKPEVYEIETKSGKKIFLNNEGMEVSY